METRDCRKPSQNSAMRQVRPKNTGFLEKGKQSELKLIPEMLCPHVWQVIEVTKLKE